MSSLREFLLSYVIIFLIRMFIFLNDLSQKNEKTHDAKADLIIGCDGAFSAVRRHMVQSPGFNFSQTFIDHGYIELCIPPADNEVIQKTNLLSPPKNIFNCFPY